MSPRFDPEPSSPLLPFDDTADYPDNASRDPRSPTAFISYSHEAPEHDDRVLDLANRLRAEGVDCEIDKYQVSPPEGWPLWMQTKVQKSDFVIVVCTGTYARRCTGNEEPGKGLGAAWESRSIHQILYDAVGNRQVIPVVFDHADVVHIPLALKSATYYDLSRDDGYRALHQALTNQPRVEKPPLGPTLRRLPALAPGESDVLALLRLCPDPLPVEVVARVLGERTTEVATTLRRLALTAVLDVGTDEVRLTDRSLDGIAAPSDNLLVGAALGATLDFVENHRNGPGRAQMMNVVALMKTANLQTASAQVSRTFRTIQSWLKSAGDKHLVLEVARRSVAASRVSGRGREQVKDEAVAAVCGVSWVYQRTERLSEALAEAERSLALGQALDPPWDRNTAFCHKCLGRLKRVSWEVAQNADQGLAPLKHSVELLEEAIREFTELKLEAEVGDCYSLLARTHLFADNREAARDAIRQAEQRLIDPTNKDYLDLQIVKGDLALRVNRRSAEIIYTDVLPEQPNADLASTRGRLNDAQKSEIIARAYLQRGKVRSILGDRTNARADFEEAAKIWEVLEDPAADSAYWEIERNAPWMDRETERLLLNELVGVRVRAARIVGNATAERPVGRAHRGKLPRKYLDGVIRQAREQLVRDRPAW